MKKQLIIILICSILVTVAIIFLISPKNKENLIGDNEIVHLQYKEKVNGYNIDILWKPQYELKSLKGKVGPAIITFKSKNNNFSTTNSHHYVPDSIAQLSLKSKIISLDYKAADSLETSLYPFANIDIPLFFLDVNFDGVDELIITKKGTGQRFWNTFDVYEIDDGEIKEPFYQITSKKPFVDFDIATKIDKMKKEITTYLSGGACDSSYKLYAFKNEKLQLVKQIERWLNENDICMQKEYSYKNGKRKKIYEGHFKADSLAIHPTGN